MRLSSGSAMPLWDVELIINDNAMYLSSGGRQFASTYDLGAGHLLVFRYDNVFMLNVMVFPPSTCRKQYPQPNA
jgi:hypothetical protein